MRRFYTGVFVFMFLMVIVLGAVLGAEKTITLRYAHMNPANSVAGIQATLFAKLVEDYTKGQVKIQVYPASQLGNLQEVAENVTTGSIALCHNTMAAIGSLFQDFGALDTPYLYRDVNHLMKVTNPNSPIMKKLNDGLIKTSNARVLYTFYFGTRQLTAKKAIYSPDDLKGVKIRAIPFPIYTATIEGMGATAVPLDWAETPTALANGTVGGQENPLDTIYSSKLYDVQTHLMLTGHIMGAEVVILNEKIWEGFSSTVKAAIQRAANEASQKGTELTIQREAEELAQLKANGMTVIGPENGLKINDFKEKVSAEINSRFGGRYGKLYQEIRAIK
jgi:TRAP-type transport system periplasmic protein